MFPAHCETPTSSEVVNAAAETASAVNSPAGTAISRRVAAARSSFPEVLP
ncbi:hypothetical protein [Nocardia farcinica]|nr:hypothetical protein [Nocardia farcinica]